MALTPSDGGENMGREESSRSSIGETLGTHTLPTLFEVV